MKANRLGVYVLLVVVLFGSAADAGLLGRLLGGKREGRGKEADLPASVQVVKDIAYGNHENQKIDVYYQQGGQNLPVLFMVHGGGWRRGDKGGAHVAGNKAAHWVPKGFVFISANYRMVPDADPVVQADDVRAALAFAQAHAQEWGGNPDKFIIMGHSAGAHLVAMATAVFDESIKAGVRPWLGSIYLDSGALNVEKIMSKRHPRLYDKAFGDDPALWRAASPTLIMQGRTVPALIVCSSRRKTVCEEANEYAERARALGNVVEVQPEDLGHGPILGDLAKDNDYTRRVERFMGKLDAAVARRLGY